MDKREITKLIERYGLVSDQVDKAELTVVLGELVRSIDSVEGSIVEFGCYRGTTSLYIKRVLDKLAPALPFHVYDSFEGLPEKAAQDSSPAGMQFVAGELAVSKKDFINEFKKAGLALPHIHKGWFDALGGEDVPEPIAFAFLDGDYYDSIRQSLRLIEGKLAPGATVVVDDYANEALPGAARALDEWIRARRLSVRTVASLGIVRLN